MSGWVPIDLCCPPMTGSFLGFGIVARECGGIDDQPRKAVIEGLSKTSDYPGYYWIVEPTDQYSIWMKLTHWMEIPPDPEVPVQQPKFAGESI